MYKEFKKTTATISRSCRASILVAMVIVSAAVSSGCAQEIPTIFATTQSDGWSAQPIAINNRFTPDATLNPVDGKPEGDTGYHLSVLTRANYWDLSSSESFVTSFIKHPWGHAWLILESPHRRTECGHSGNYGVTQPFYHDRVFQAMRDGEPDPIAHIRNSVYDGQYELGNPGKDPTFVWRVPITKRAYERIDEYIQNRDYKQFNLSIYNCGDMVTHVTSLAGINLASMIRITFPSEGDVQGHHLHIWTDPKYGTFEFRSIDLLELETRHLVRLGIGSDATAEYLASKPYEPLKRLNEPEVHLEKIIEQDGNPVTNWQ